jgi:hypothetical protein
MDASIRAGLRALSREEEGLGFNCLPAGVYGFTYAPLSESPLFSRQGYHAFEMQRLPDGSGRLIAYLSAAEAEAIETGDEALELGVYPEPYNDAVERRSLPLDHISPVHRNPTHEDGNRLAIIWRRK